MTDKEEKKQSCLERGYMGRNPGTAHIRCNFDWAKAEIKAPAGHPHGIRKGWYIFPVNYDPTWMIGSCPVYTETIDPEMVVKKRDAFTELMGILGSVGRV